MSDDLFPPEEERRIAERRLMSSDQVSIKDIWDLLQQHIMDEQAFRSQLYRAFPKDKYGEIDFYGHCNYHEQLIDRAVKNEETKGRLIEKIVGGGIWALLILIGTALMTYLKEHILK